MDPSLASVCYIRSMSEPDREIPQRELRNNVAKILKEVESGRRLRITVRGKPVADLVPISQRRRFVPRAVTEAIIRDHPLDADFERDIADAVDETIEDPWERYSTRRSS